MTESELCMIVAVAFAVRILGEWLVNDYYFTKYKKLLSKEANNDRN